MNLAALAVNVLTGPSLKMDQVDDSVEILATGETGSIVGIRNLADCTGTRFDVALSGGTQELRRYHFRNLRLGA